MNVICKQLRTGLMGTLHILYIYSRPEFNMLINYNRTKHTFIKYKHTAYKQSMFITRYLSELQQILRLFGALQ